MKAQSTNILSEKVAIQTGATASVTPEISAEGEPSLLSPKNTIRAKIIAKAILYGLVLFGFPIFVWIIIGRDYSIWEDPLAWIAGISILGIFFIKFIKDNLSWDSIKNTFKWLAIICILIIVFKEAFFREATVGEKGATDFSVISIGAHVKENVNKMIEKSQVVQSTVIPPDYKIYQPRSEPYVFDLKAGETTDHWIMFPSGRNNNIDFKSENFKFVIEYYEGDKYNCWEISSLPHKTRLKFKLKSIDGQPIEMVAK